MSSKDQNTETVRRFLEVFSSGNVPDTMAMMADTATWWVAGTLAISGTHDKQAFRALLTRIAATCTGPIKITPKAFTAEGERVAVEAESLVQTLNGRTYNNHYHFLFTVRDGKIAGVKEYLDTMHTQAVFLEP